MDCNLGRRNPHLRQAFEEVLINGKVLATKRNYASCIMDYLRFCHDNEEPPVIGDSLNPTAVRFWMQTRVWQLDSSNSHKTWSAALTWLCQCYNLPASPPLHQRDPDFAFWYNGVKRSAHRKTQAKQPLRACHLWRYIRDKLDIVPGQLHKARYDNLVKACALVTIFLTMSRCMEVLWSDKTEKKEVREIITGLRWRDITFTKDAKARGGMTLTIKVRWFKNQEDRRVPKIITMVTPCCGATTKGCVCPFFDIFAQLREMKRMRANRFADITPFRASGKGTLGHNQQKNLGHGPDDFVFVNARGTILKYRFISALIKDVVIFNKIDTSKLKITPHSLRVGATSLAHHQRIDPLKVMRYVEWMPSQSPTMHAHYVRYTEEQLSLIPYEMLHGSLQFGEPTQNFIRSEPVTFELRAEVIRATLYEGDAHKDLKAKGARTRRAPVYDPDPTDALN